MQEFIRLRSKIFDIRPEDFNQLALSVYRFQYQHNPVYRKYVDLLGKNEEVKDICTIPYLPVELFKHHKIIIDLQEPADFFESSGTTGSLPGRHYFQDLDTYQKSYELGFRQAYGDPADWTIIGLLPSYLERRHASLVNMADGLMKLSGSPDNGFYLYNYQQLTAVLERLKAESKKVLLIGVTFALIELAEQFPGSYPNVTLIETGGMKGRGKERTREELHDLLSTRLNPGAIHSEYGMSEMFSQAYSLNNGIFYCAPTMKVIRRDPYDPLQLSTQPGRGNINVIDLSNLHSCSFLATMDLGEFYADNGFRVLGRSDYSDVRGCNLMMS